MALVNELEKQGNFLFRYRGQIPVILFALAVESLASSIIIAHNHPSGSLKPSQQDIRLTSKVKNAGNTLDINLLDHIIITKEGYYSFADEMQL